MQDRFQTMSDQVSILDFLMIFKKDESILMWSKSSTVPFRKAPKQNSNVLNPEWFSFDNWNYTSFLCKLWAHALHKKLVIVCSMELY